MSTTGAAQSREHEGDALERVVGVDRDVGAAGLEDGEHGHQHLGAALQAQADDDVGADAERAQVVRERLAWRSSVA